MIIGRDLVGKLLATLKMSKEKFKNMDSSINTAHIVSSIDDCIEELNSASDKHKWTVRDIMARINELGYISTFELATVILEDINKNATDSINRDVVDRTITKWPGILK